MHKKHQKHQKAQKRNQAKAQNANKRTETKNALKKHEWKKVTDSLICVFVLAKKKKKKSLNNRNVGPTKPVKVLY